ncbi:MAG: hypothetical protein VX317_09930, partial [Verrucomicrobiota bacterium]|nr:hypothetical protein [Verrucomicrobiota bacterium]
RADIGQPPLKVKDLVAPPPLPKTDIKTSGSAARTSGPITGTDGIRRILITLGILIWCALCTIPMIRRFKERNRAGRE